MGGPVDIVYVDGVPVAKSAVRGFDKLRMRLRVANADEVRNTDFSGYFGGLYTADAQAFYDIDTSDTTTPDDGAECIVDAAGNRFKRIDTGSGGSSVYLSVRSFGATGDDSTDDTAAINAAIAAAAAATPQRAVYFPAGTYRVTALSNIPPNIALVGENRKTSVIRTTSATADVITLDGSNAQIRNLQIDCSTTRSAGYFIKLTNNGQRITVENVNLVAPFNGIYIPSTIALVQLVDIDISETVATSGSSIFVDGGYVISLDRVVCRNSTCFAHLNINHVEDITLTNCQFLQSSYPINLSPGSGKHIGLLLATNSQFDAPIGQAIRVTPSTGGTVNRVLINNCWIAQASGGSNVLVTNVGGGAVNGLSIENSTFPGATNGIGAELVGVSNIHLRGNRIGAHTTGISASNCTNLVITGNRIGATDGYATNTTGISLSGTTDYAYVVANDINGNGTEISNTASGTHNIIALSGDATSVGLNAVAGLTPAADRLPYFTGARTAALATLTAAGRALIDDADAAAQRVTLGIRDVLTGARTYYVRTDGSDSNTGLVNSSGGAFLTIQKAVDVIFGTLDLAGFNVTIQLGNTGTWTGNITVSSPQVGAGTITLNGDTTTANTGSYIVTSSSGTTITVSGFGTKISLQGFELRSAAAGGINAINGGFVTLSGYLRFGATATSHMRANHGTISADTISYAIAGAATHHYQCSPHGYMNIFSCSVTVVAGTFNFSTAFAYADRQGMVTAAATSYTLTGTVTGVRYTVETQGQIYTAGGGASFFPGNSAGSANGTNFALYT